MNLGICYFYEYGDNTRLRNTGFLKISKQYHTCLLNMNIRGISVKSGDSIELYAFFQQDSDYMSKKVGRLSCNDKNICAKLSISETDFPDNRTLENMDGFFLKTDGGQCHAVLLKDGKFNPHKVLHWQANEIHTKTPEEAIETSTEETVETSTKETVETSTKETVEASIFEYATHSDLETAWAFDPDTEVIISLLPKDSQALEIKSDEVSSPSQSFDNTPDSIADTDSPETVKATKIQRSGLSVLPRRCWNLANNSFLMHGYHNYHHLLLVEEENHFWLGVPGVYSPRESRASEFFGFPQFTRSYTDLVHLEDDEQNKEEDFGYWCRFIK